MLKDKRESQTVEFKESWDDDNIRYVSAFSNTTGGTLYIGVRDDGVVVGIDNIDVKKFLEDIPNKINQKTHVLPIITVHKQGKKQYIAIEIAPSANRISYRGHYYWRSGTMTTELQGEQLSEFLSVKFNTTWDALVFGRDKEFRMNKKTIAYFKEIAKDHLHEIGNERNSKRLLERLGLITRNGLLTHAAILLFDTRPQVFYPQLIIKIGRYFEGEELQSIDIIDGNLFEQVKGAMEILRRKYLRSAIYMDGIYRKEKLIIPEAALREAILNAIIHRDMCANTYIYIEVYSNRLVISNPGTLPPELSIQSLWKKHKSYPRNKLVADTFFKAGLIEAWGSGTTKIIKLCKEGLLPAPKFVSTNTGIETIFYFKPEDSLLTSPMTSPITSPMTSPMADSLTTADKIIDLIKHNSKITRQQMALQLNISLGGVKYNLAELQKSGRIKFVGSPRFGHWEIIEPQE